MSGFVFLVFLELLAVAIISISFCNGSTYVGCIQSEREALLKFKQDLIDSNRLSSWVGDGDCCNWVGVVCNNLTGHVLELHLENLAIYHEATDAEFEAYEWSRLGGKINPSLLDLNHLVYLNLSYNQFEGVQFPVFLCSMRYLSYLDIREAGFAGVIPHQLGNLSGLQYLDLSWNGLYADSLSWLSSLSSLKYLSLSGSFFSTTSDWLLEVNKLSSLTMLRLDDCGLHHIPPLSFANFSSSLTTLDLSWNHFHNSLILSWVFGLQSLEYLDLSSNNFQGPIPKALQNLTSLQHLDLSNNNFNSSIPNWLSRLRSLEFLDIGYNSNLQGSIPRSWGRLCNLKSFSSSGIKLNQDIHEIIHIFSRCILDGLVELLLSNCQLYGQLTNNLIDQAKNLEVLDISYNSIAGHVPSSLGKFSSLQTLDFSYNKLNGTLLEIHFADLTRLRYFKASGNSLIVKFNHDWIPPFQLEFLSLSSCHLGPQFPSWFRSQQNLYYVDISSSGIVDSIPSWFWKSVSQFFYLNLSHNHIQGKIPNLTSATNLYFIDLNSNNLSGSLPLISPKVSTLDLSNNVLSGSISQFLCHNINETKFTEILKLGNNSLSGELTDCWMNWEFFSVLELSNNKFTGNLPNSLGDLSALQSLHLRHNSFFGVIPSSLKTCTELLALDIGENEFSGNIPAWMGESFSKLVILNLRSNKFHGFLPMEFCHLSSLQILDLAYNNFSGSIPKCINKFSAMVAINYSKDNNIQLEPNIQFPSNLPVIMSIEDELLVMKGKTAIYSSILNLVRSIDLSKNNFFGEIPVEVTSLHALMSLNLSHNSLTGKIPETIGDMREMESMDVSSNWLSGKIPQSITSLTFLSVLNLSDNKLTGRIPLGTQLQSFNASSFIGNELCGSPLKNCTVATVPTPSHQNGGHEVDWFYVSMVLGFVVGFWSLIGPLLINRRWRYMYCCFLDRLGDKFYFAFRKFH